MKKGKLYIIQGFIGAGKSTYSKKLQEKTGAIHYNPDEWVSKLFKKEEFMQNWNQCFDEVLRILWEKTKEDLKNGKDVIFDMGFWLRKDRDYARTIANECSAETELIFLNVPDEILKNRIVKDRPPELAKRHLQNFEENKKKFEIPQEYENATIIKNFTEDEIVK